MTMGMILYILMFLLLGVGVTYVVTARHPVNPLGGFLDWIAVSIMVMMTIINFAMGRVRYGLIMTAIVTVWSGIAIWQYRMRPRDANSDGGSNEQ